MVAELSIMLIPFITGTSTEKFSQKIFLTHPDFGMIFYWFLLLDIYP
jgi:hypothetical protein